MRRHAVPLRAGFDRHLAIVYNCLKHAAAQHKRVCAHSIAQPRSDLAALTCRGQGLCHCDILLCLCDVVAILPHL
jgi:hypothetical protein